ncbi:MAG: hypothetical protein ACK44X_10715 [Burkholderiales bacterium]
MKNENDNEAIEELLVRSGDYLMERTARYREQPVRTSASRQDAPRRYRRVLVGTAAAATLCVTALAGSFIGGTSSGKVDVAEAAWSAIPATPTAEQVNKAKLDCGITAEILAAGENVPPNSIPDYMLEPSLVDVRGTTTTATYFTWTKAKLCVQFGDGSIDAPEVEMTRHDEFAWQEPIALDLFADISATMILGFLPPNISDTEPNSTGESDKIIESQWEAYVDAPGVERTKASVNGAMERFVAWVPTTGNFKVTFVNTKTGEERVVGATTGSLGFSVAPNTTIAEPPKY